MTGAAPRDPAEVVALLEGASDRLSKLAGAATPGSWRPDRFWWKIGSARGMSDGYWCSVDVDEGHVALMSEQDDDEGDRYWSAASNAAWIAAMSPAVAAPLAAWLRSQVRFAAVGGVDPEAVEVARVILGAAQDALEPVGAESAGEASGGSATERPATAPVSAERGARARGDGSGATTGPLEAAGGDRQ